MNNLKTVRVTASDTIYYEIEINVPASASNKDILESIEPEDALVADECSLWQWNEPCEVGFNPNANVINVEDGS